MKKRSEMTTKERMEWIMTGATWDEAEDVGVEMLARCMALHVYSRKEGADYMNALFERIVKRADEWAHEPGNPMVLAIAALGDKLKKGD